MAQLRRFRVQYLLPGRCDSVIWAENFVVSEEQTPHAVFYEVLLLCLDCEFWKVGTERKRRSSAVFMAVDRCAGLKEGPFCS